MNITDIRRNNLALLLRTRFNGNKKALGDAVGRQAGYVGGMLPNAKNQRSFGESNARDFEHRLGLPAGWLDTPQGETPSSFQEALPLERKFRRTRIVGTAQLGPEGYWDAMTVADGWLDVPTNDPDAYSLRVKGDSMAPAIRNGWAVWCEPNHALVPGEYVVVRRTNGECMVKELLYENRSEVSLMAVNANYGRLTIPRDEIEQIHYVGGIVPPSRIMD
ncbi:TPA: helix-turn-helix transcriptional regulator [Pseudomonas aeruginosa]